MHDLLDMQDCNLQNLPENYQFKYYLYHAFCWPQMLYVNRDFSGKVRGYVMAKMEDDPEKPEHGHVTSVSVLRTARKLGVASFAMKRAMHATQEVFGGHYISLHVRCTNEAAVGLYHNSLGYKVHDIDKQYYGDMEDAYEMKHVFGTDPYGARIVRVSRSQKHDGLLEWPKENAEGKLKFDDFLQKKLTAEKVREEIEKEGERKAMTKRRRRK